jgi:pimeloyl-ACP methyl ester carboxylesterase
MQHLSLGNSTVPEKMDLNAACFIEVDRLKLRILRSRGGRGVPIMLTSPWPESLYAFDRIWPTLTAVAPLVALDLPGFGRSEGRADVMSPKAMGAFLPKVIDALGLDRIHAVGPDVGTSALLFAARSYPDLFESLVVGSGATDAALTTGGLTEIIAAPSTQPFEDGAGEDFATGAIDRMMKNKPDAWVLDDYRASSSGKRFIEAMAYVRAYPGDLSELRGALSEIRTPVLSIWGSHDPIVPTTNADVLNRALPKTRSILLDAGHFVWEDRADEYAVGVLDWIRGGYSSI